MTTADFDEDDVEPPFNPDQDGVAALHDSEAEAGDEEGVRDAFVLDQREAHELGVDLDPVEGPEAELN